MHYWAPVPEILAFLKEKFAGGRVLDVGPGHSPLPWATTSVDFVDAPGAVNQIKCDLSKDPLPFPDKSFDFVYCRHMLEDMFNPFPICDEMSRVGKAGYIETPSPMAELCRGVDGSSPGYRGYHHHRFVVWNHFGPLKFVSKYPLIEYLRLDKNFSASDENIVRVLRKGPRYWNTSFLWRDRIKFQHLQSPLDFDVGQNYQSLLSQAVDDSLNSTDEFWRQIPEQTEIITPGLRSLVSSNV